MGRLITTGPRHIRFEGRVTGVRLGNGFLDTRSCPVNTDLDFAGLPFALCPPLLGIGIVTRPGLAPSFLTPCSLGFLLFVWLLPTIYFMGCHLGPGRPLILFLGSQSSVSQSVEC